MAFPPDSPLSSLEGSIASEDGHETEEDGTLLRPSKRQKTDGGSAASSSATAALMPEPEAEVVPGPDPLEGLSDVSSDTSGDIPSSPVSACLDLEDFQEQVTACEWDGCDAGDQRNMDRLVEHIHNSHIESRQKKYTCEWTSCSRKGLPHASGYALKAHMRSHTREKPFYCYLPGTFASLFLLSPFFFLSIERERGAEREKAIANLLGLETGGNRFADRGSSRRM